MFPVRHPSTTRELGAPRSWDEKRRGPCSMLAIADVMVEGLPFMESLWEPTPDELAALTLGEKVILRIQGSGHPVVSVGATAPAAETADLTRAKRHNALAPTLITRLLTECPDEAEALVVVESLLFGLMSHFRPQPDQAMLVLAEVVGRAIVRLREQAGG